MLDSFHFLIYHRPRAPLQLAHWPHEKLVKDNYEAYIFFRVNHYIQTLYGLYSCTGHSGQQRLDFDEKQKIREAHTKRNYVCCVCVWYNSVVDLFQNYSNWNVQFGHYINGKNRFSRPPLIFGRTPIFVNWYNHNISLPSINAIAIKKKQSSCIW